MTKLTYPLTVDTLGKVKALGTRISINCNICHKHTMLDMDKLIERLGEDHGCMDWDLRPRFHCERCRAEGRNDKNFSFIMHADARSDAAIKNDYLKAKGGY